MCVAACSFSVAVLAAADLARGHIQDSTAGITSDYYTPAHAARCIYGPGSCSQHSFTFISAAELYSANHYICAEVYYPSNHSPPAGGDCDWAFIRYCHGPTHTAGAEHCIDSDSNQFHVGARNNSNSSVHIRRHGVY
jgi:hypothetical protein